MPLLTPQDRDAPPQQPCARVLLVQTGSVAACLATTPWISALAARDRPDVLDVAAHPRAVEVFARHPAVRRTFELGDDLRQTIALVHDARRIRYELIIDLCGSRAAALLTLLGGAASRITPAAGAIPGSGEQAAARGDEPKGLARFFAQLALALPPGDPVPEFMPAPEACSEVEQTLLQLGFVPGRPFVLLCPGAEATEDAAGEYWAALARGISERCRLMPLAMLPARDEECVRLIAALAGDCMLLGARTLSHAASIIAGAALVVTADPACRALARSQHVPLVPAGAAAETIASVSKALSEPDQRGPSP